MAVLYVLGILAVLLVLPDVLFLLYRNVKYFLKGLRYSYFPWQVVMTKLVISVTFSSMLVSLHWSGLVLLGLSGIIALGRVVRGQERLPTTLWALLGFVGLIAFSLGEQFPKGQLYSLCVALLVLMIEIGINIKNRLKDHDEEKFWPRWERFHFLTWSLLAVVIMFFTIGHASLSS